MVLPQLVIPRRNLQPLRQSGNDSDSSEPVSMHPVPTDRDSVVPNRPGATEHNGLDSPSATLHIAIVVKDIRLYDAIRNGTYVITPPLWKGEIQLHIVMQKNNDTPEALLLKLAAVDLGLANATVIGLNDGLQISMGWPSDE